VPEGFLLSGVSSGIKKANRLDLGLIYLQGFAEGVCFFTNNLVKAAPLILNIKKLKKSKGRIKAVIVNSGNANCFTGKRGLRDAENICSNLSRLLGVSSASVLACSTGIIGKRLPTGKILRSLPGLVSELNKDPSRFASSILTTDTFKKVSSRQIRIKRETVSILGVAKGAGMIYPRLKQATMLVFILCDVNIKRSLLKEASGKAVESSFNSITVDGCTSTNDSVFFLTSKRANGAAIESRDKDFEEFSKALNEVCLDLAKKIIQDAEGSTKFLKIRLRGARTESEAKTAGLSIANSNLFKTAIYGENNNWGRIIAALGQAGIHAKENITIRTSSLKKNNIEIIVDLKRGRASWTVYTSDLTPEYIKINAHYS